MLLALAGCSGDSAPAPTTSPANGAQNTAAGQTSNAATATPA
ncbi:MAG TPA: class F sortase, partial [Planctomycetaceae bacterium]|nr:class F sortase [Planctomycetaceae bacterium]